MRQDLRGAHARRVGTAPPSAAFVAEAAGGAAIDMLVNNAGGVRGQVGRPIEEISEHDWHTIFDVNLSPAHSSFAQAVAPGMKQKKRRPHHQHLQPRRAGDQPDRHPGLRQRQGGQIGLTRQLAHELGPWDITVNNVAPGFVRSNPTTERQWDSMAKRDSAAGEIIALKRLGAPEDIAHA